MPTVTEKNPASEPARRKGRYGGPPDAFRLVPPGATPYSDAKSHLCSPCGSQMALSHAGNLLGPLEPPGLTEKLRGPLESARKIRVSC